MKVIFKKKHQIGGVTYLKDQVLVIHWTDATELLKKGIVEETDILTEEDKVLKQFRDGDNG